MVMEHMVRLCQHVGDEAVERAKTQVRLLEERKETFFLLFFSCGLFASVRN